MDGSRLILSAQDQLRQIRSDIPVCSSIDGARELFHRLREIRRQHPDDFDLQVVLAEAENEVIERARFLRKESGAPTVVATPKAESPKAPITPKPNPKTVLPVVPEPPPEDVPEVAEIPPEVPKLDQRSWKLAVGLSILFTAGIFASFFYLIQTARRLNFAAESPPPIVVPPSDQGIKKAVSVVAPPHLSMTPSMRLYTDLTGGTATIDDQAPKDLVDGELNVEDLKPGAHSVRVESRSGSAAFTFSLDDPNDVPHVTGISKSTNAMVVLVSVKDGVGRLTTDASGAEIALDDKPAGTVASDGLLLSGLGTQDHSLDVTQGHDKQKFVLTYTPSPTLTVFVKSDPSTGVLTVSAGQEGVSVFINDVLYKRMTTHGEVRIPLKVGVYRIRVHKDGFQDSAVNTVEVKKSAEASVQFHLLPAATSQLAVLQIKGAQPGTAVYMDHQATGTVGVDGTATVINIQPGVHLIELAHDQEVTKQLGRTFNAGETLTLTGADVALDRLAADNKSVIPANPGPPVIPPPEVPQLQPPAVSVPGEQTHKGGGFIPYRAPKAPGRYYFEAHTKLGGVIKRGKLQWYAGYQDPENYVLYSLDGKHAEVRQVRDGKAVDVGKIPFAVGSDEWVQIEISVKADTLQARAKASGDWIDLAPVTGSGHDFTKDGVGLYVPSNDEVAVANFRFSGH